MTSGSSAPTLFWPLLVVGILVVQSQRRAGVARAELDELEKRYQDEAGELELQVELLGKQLQIEGNQAQAPSNP